MIKRFGQEKVFCGIDLGAERIKVAVIKGRQIDHLTLVGSHIGKIHGFQNASVTDIAELSDCIQRTVETAGKKANVKIKDVFLGLGNDLIEARFVDAAIPLVEKGHKIVTRRDIFKIDQQAQILGTRLDEEIIHSVPQFYKVDDQDVVLNPVGLYARKIFTRSLLLLSTSTRLKNIIKAVNQAGFDVADVLFNSFAAANAVLKESFLSKGFAVLDVGASKTDVMVFHDGVLKFFKQIEKGGENFTRSIAQAVDVSFELAEHIKRSHASAIRSERFSEEEILIKQRNAYRPIPKKMIYEALMPQVEILAQEIREALETSGLFASVTDVVVLGGGAFLPGLLEHIGHELNRPVQLGRLKNIVHDRVYHISLLIPAIGLAECGFGIKAGNASVLEQPPANAFQFVCGKISDIYQEYF